MKKVVGEIRERVPVGFNWHETPREDYIIPTINNVNPLWDKVVGDNYQKATNGMQL